MKPLFLATALALVPVLAAFAPRTAPVRPASPALVAEETPLAEAMDTLKANLKVLARSAQDPAKETEALEALSAMQAAVLQAKTYDPQNLMEVPAAERDAHKRAFREQMLVLLQRLAGLEILLLEGKRSEVVAEIKGPLMELRNAAHERFQTKD
jgi:soluble cytochrome b562